MNKYLVRNFKWIENLGKVPAKVYRLAEHVFDFKNSTLKNCLKLNSTTIIVRSYSNVTHILSMFQTSENKISEVKVSK